MTTTTTTTDLTDLTDLASRVRGPVLAGDDSRAAEELAAFNLAHDLRPAVVVGATTAEDVAAAVTWAVHHRLGVAVQATGHGAVSGIVGAVLVSTRRMDTVVVDPVRRTARVGGGARWATVNDAAAAYGLAGVSGSSSGVGVVGYSLGGGLGLLSREYGFGADQVLSLELVTADGEVRRVDADTDPELFWAVRGGKGNFGIATEVEIALVPAAEVYGGGVFFAAGSATEVLHSFRAWAPTLPERSSTSLALLRLPPVEALPEPLRGRSVVHLRFAHRGSEAEGAELLAPMLEAGEVVLPGVGMLPMTAADAIHQDPTEPMPVHERGLLLRELGADTVTALLEAAGPGSGSPLPLVELRLMGGALGRQPAVPNAVAGREGAWSVLALGVLAPGAQDAVPAATGRVVDALEPWSTGTILVNWLGARPTRPRWPAPGGRRCTAA